VPLAKRRNAKLSLVPRRDAAPLERATYASWLRHRWKPPARKER
jgi:hypothetical protein